MKSPGSDSHFPAASPNVTFSGIPASVCQRSKQDPYCFRTVNIQKDPKSVGPGSIPAYISTPTATVFKDTNKIIFVGPLIVNGNIVSRVVTHWQLMLTVSNEKLCACVLFTHPYCGTCLYSTVIFTTLNKSLKLIDCDWNTRKLSCFSFTKPWGAQKEPRTAWDTQQNCWDMSRLMSLQGATLVFVCCNNWWAKWNATRLASGVGACLILLILFSEFFRTSWFYDSCYVVGGVCNKGTWHCAI